MAYNDYINKLEMYRFYLILSLTSSYFLIELIFSHMSHSLTLLIDSYHMFCNIVALTGCLLTINFIKKECVREESKPPEHSVAIKMPNNENKLINTFGWTRINILVMLICFVLLASFCFSIVVEALQTLVHIDQRDEMHYPLHVLVIGVFGFVLNSMCYLLIGGYTFRQEHFLYITDQGGIALNKITRKDQTMATEQEIMAVDVLDRGSVPKRYRHENRNVSVVFRDLIGCFFVIVCALVVYFVNDNIGKYLDPIISIVSSISLIFINYPYMKESGSILLQTIPDTINIDSLQTEIMQKFPQTINIHDFHIWQLTKNKVISTIHVVFRNIHTYVGIKNELVELFNEYGITHVTIQPEFLPDKRYDSNTTNKRTCLMECAHELCKKSLCCQNDLKLPNAAI